MRAMDALLLEARAAAAHSTSPAFRRGAANEARAYLEHFDLKSASGTQRAAAGLALLMQAWDEFQDGEAHALLAAALDAAVSGIRAERAAALRRNPDAQVRRYWTEGPNA